MEDQAYALSRSLVECALNLRYLTEELDELAARTNKYIQFEKTEKQYWMYWALQILKGTSRETAILDYAKDYGLSPDTKGASRHWSGENGFAWHTNLKDRPLDGDQTIELGKKHNMQLITFRHHRMSIAVQRHSIISGPASVMTSG